MVSSQFIPLNEDGRVFVSSRHIKREQLVGVWLQQLADDVWVNVNIDDYQLVNNAIVFDDDILSSTYSQIELRVGDTESDLGLLPSDISTLASIESDIQLVADNITPIVNVSDNIESILTATSAADTATSAALAAEGYKDEALVSANNASSSETNAQGYSISASTSANNASTSESNASTSATEASNSATSSQLKAWEAEAEKMTADSYATEDEDVFVKIYTSNGDGTFTSTNSTEYSSKHYSLKAEIEKDSVGDADTIVYDNTTSGLTATNVNDAIDEVITSASTTPLNISSQLKGDYSIVTNELVLTDGLFSISNGFVSKGVDNTILELTGSLTPTNGWSDGNDFVKVLEDGSTVSTLETPTFGTISATGDYLLNGLWYDKLGALYANQFTYASKDGKLLEVEVAGGVPVDLHYNEEAPKILENVAKFNKVIAETSGKNSCTAWVNFDGTTTPPTIRDSFNVSDVVRTATGIYEIFLSVEYDNNNYSVIVTSTGSSDGSQYTVVGNSTHGNVGFLRTTNSFVVPIGFVSSLGAVATSFNSSDINIEIKGGKA